MHEEVPSRLLTVLVLALVGTSVGWVGSGLGIGGPLTEPGQNPALVVSEGGVTVSDGSQEVTVLENVTTVESLRIRDRDGHLTVDTERVQPLTDAERARALAIVRENETVQRRLAAMDDYELAVEPIRGVPAEAMSRISLNGSEVNRTAVDEEEEGIFRVGFDENASIERSDDAVTIRPGDQTYVEDDVNVEIRTPDTDEVVAEAQVNLPDERVVIVTEE